MNSATAIKELRLLLVAEMAKFGLTLPVIKANQAKKQGRVDDGVYFQQMGTKCTGWQKREYASGVNFKQVEQQHYETTVRFTVIADDVDIAAKLQRIMSSANFIRALRKKAIGIQRIAQINTLVFVNDSDNYESEISFDVVISYTDELARDAETVTTANLTTAGV